MRTRARSAGRSAGRTPAGPGWLRRAYTAHIIGMGGSYIAMLSAFYADNGPRLPLWDQLLPLALWLLPTVIGLPLLLRVVIRYRPDSWVITGR